MIKMKGQFKILKFDKIKITKKLKESCEIMIREAARAFVRAAIKRVPVLTGTAKGSFMPIGRYLNIAIDIKPKKKEKGKGPEVGARKSNFEIDYKYPKYNFNFSTNVEHYYWNELFARNYKRPQIVPPWLSFAYGRKAYVAYLKNNFKKKLPNIKKQSSTIIIGNK